MITEYLFVLQRTPATACLVSSNQSLIVLPPQHDLVSGSILFFSTPFPLIQDGSSKSSPILMARHSTLKKNYGALKYFVESENVVIIVTSTNFRIRDWGRKMESRIARATYRRRPIITQKIVLSDFKK